MKTTLKILSIFALIVFVISSCRKDEPTVGEPRLNIPEDQGSIAISREANTVTIDVESNRIWEINTFSSSSDWFRITPASLEGEGNGRITVTVNSNPAPGLQRQLELTITTIGGLSQQVIITQEGEAPIEKTLIYADNFGTGATSSGTPAVWPSVASWTAWNITGSSVGTIWYYGTGATVRTTLPSMGYPGASGGNNVMFAAGVSGAGGSLIINGIVPDSYQYFTLSFGTNQNHDTLSVSFSTDNGFTWEPISFNKTTTGWGLVQADFSLPAVVDSFSLKFSALGTGSGARIDDVQLRGSDEQIPALSVSPNSLDIPRVGDSRSVYITSNTDWTVTPSAEWVTVSSISGNGSYTLVVNIQENTTGGIRSATITISADGLPNQIIVIEQSNVEIVTLAHWNPTSATDLTDNISGSTISVSTGATIGWASGQSAIVSSGWHNAIGDHWLLTIPLSVEISGIVNINLVVTGSNTGPRDFIVRASSDNNTWIDGDIYTVSNVAINHADAQKALSVDLGSTTISAGGTLYIRLATTSGNAISGTLGSAGTNRLTEIEVFAAK